MVAIKPIIFAVDDEPEVLRAIELDLRRQYGAQYRILRANSGSAALDTLKKLKLRSDPVALFLVDQRMPQMTGVEFLAEAIELYPDAKRVLLTAYSDIDAAISAINRVGINHYLLKPWDPPEEHLYPVLNDLLDDWRAQFFPPFEGIRVISDRWSPTSHRVRDFLARNQIPYRWLDIEKTDEARELLADLGQESAELPLIVLPNGSSLSNPSNFDLAEKIGLKTQAEMPFYDLIIIGAGPAGLAAAVYAASEGLHCVMIEREAPGGQAGTSSRIENYLGFPVGLSGADLTRRAVAQARRFGAEIICPQEVASLRFDGPYRFARLASGTELSCHVMLLATGVSYNRLDVPDIDRFTGVGVYYGAAMAEAFAHSGQDVLVVGAGNSAGQAAMHFAKYARSVTMVVRGPSLGASMSQYLIEQIKSNDRIKVQFHTCVQALHGDTHLEAVTLANSKTQQSETVSTSALFIFIGAEPHTDWLPQQIERDRRGFILSGPDLVRDGRCPPDWPLKRDPFLLETSVPGIFVAGDVRYRSIKRVASAVGEGAIAVQFIHEYLGSL